jgi:hypothetical protein
MEGEVDPNRTENEIAEQKRCDTPPSEAVREKSGEGKNVNDDDRDEETDDYSPPMAWRLNFRRD